MKERPILFSGPMVRAILEGQKTVTRRVVKDTGLYAIDAAIHGNEVAQREREALSTRCPYGQPGDRLWVRETWARVGTGDPGYLVYRATYPRCLPPVLENVPRDIRDEGYSWRPSIHMPRSACRLLLEVTAVRVERLHDINDDQCRAEGATGGHGSIPGYIYNATVQEHFHHIWTSTGGDYDANPWVWVVEFQRVTP